jgi:phage gp29-like protein
MNILGYNITKAVDNKNLSTSIFNIQTARIRQDVRSWREAAEEAERITFPFRTLMQQQFNDTILNSQIYACIEKRKDTILLSDFEFEDEEGNVNEEVCDLLKKEWLSNFIGYSMDALFFGYSLISLGDITNGEFKDLNIIKRGNVSPDKLTVLPMENSSSGISFLDDDYKNWHIFVKTPNLIGSSSCGFGLLYQVAVYEIFLRNILGYNGDFVELYSQPFRVGKTNKTEEAERNAFEGVVRDMGSAGYAVMDALGDSIEFMETAKGGNGWQGYDNFELRLEKKISKVLLGHADALDSISGTLGGTQGEESPVYQALEGKKSKDFVFITNIINAELLPRLRNLGFKIPDNVVFKFKNDNEKFEHNQKLTALAVEIKKAGLQVDNGYFEEKTGIKLNEIIVPSTKIQNRINELYR